MNWLGAQYLICHEKGKLCVAFVNPRLASKPRLPARKRTREAGVGSHRALKETSQTSHSFNLGDDKTAATAKRRKATEGAGGGLAQPPSPPRGSRGLAGCAGASGGAERSGAALAPSPDTGLNSRAICSFFPPPFPLPIFYLRPKK